MEVENESQQTENTDKKEVADKKDDLMTVFSSKEHYQLSRKLAFDRKHSYKTVFGEEGNAVKKELDFCGTFSFLIL